MELIPAVNKRRTVLAMNEIKNDQKCHRLATFQNKVKGPMATSDSKNDYIPLVRKK